MAIKIESQRVDLQDGRNVRVLEYDDGSIRFRINGGGPYVIEEAFLGKDPAIIKLRSRVAGPALPKG
jgi:hypothetical protein